MAHEDSLRPPFTPLFKGGEMPYTSDILAKVGQGLKAKTDPADPVQRSHTATTRCSVDVSLDSADLSSKFRCASHGLSVFYLASR